MVQIDPPMLARAPPPPTLAVGIFGVDEDVAFGCCRRISLISSTKAAKLGVVAWRPPRPGRSACASLLPCRVNQPPSPRLPVQNLALFTRRKHAEMGHPAAVGAQRALAASAVAPCRKIRHPSRKSPHRPRSVDIDRFSRLTNAQRIAQPVSITHFRSRGRHQCGQRPWNSAPAGAEPTATRIGTTIVIGEQWPHRTRSGYATSVRRTTCRDMRCQPIGAAPSTRLGSSRAINDAKCDHGRRHAGSRSSSRNPSNLFARTFRQEAALISSSPNAMMRLIVNDRSQSSFPVSTQDAVLLAKSDRGSGTAPWHRTDCRPVPGRRARIRNPAPSAIAGAS